MDKASSNKSDDEMMDWEEYNKRRKELRGQRLKESLDVFFEAKELARRHGMTLNRHSQYHYSLTLYLHGERVWRYNLYPSNQRIWVDRKCGKAPFLNLDKPWNFLDVVKEAVKSL